jgi:hypothetical protein
VQWQLEAAERDSVVPEFILRLINDCRNVDPSARPTFSEIERRIWDDKSPRFDHDDDHDSPALSLRQPKEAQPGGATARTWSPDSEAASACPGAFLLEVPLLHHSLSTPPPKHSMRHSAGHSESATMETSSCDSTTERVNNFEEVVTLLIFAGPSHGAIADSIDATEDTPSGLGVQVTATLRLGPQAASAGSSRARTAGGTGMTADSEAV